MKKVYEKPSAYIETFELSQHIADCTLNVRGQGVDPTGTTDGCYAVYSGSDLYEGIRFFTTSSACTTDATDVGYCTYNAADPTFNSY